MYQLKKYLLLVLILLVTGCGQRGPLRLPSDQQTQQNTNNQQINTEGSVSLKDKEQHDKPVPVKEPQQ